MQNNSRLATPADLPGIEIVVRDAYSPYVGRIGQMPAPMLDDYKALIDNERVHVIEQDGAIEAILVLIPEANTLLLDNVAVLPRAQGRGLGRRLLAYAEHVAREQRCQSIRLYTNEKMTENISFYSRIGYVETHRAEECGFRRVFMIKALS
jgi:GNAT superfamily N-acetyltransferase